MASIRTWSLPLPVQPWAIVSQLVCARVLDRELGDQRPAERGEERVAVAVDGVGLDRRGEELGGEALAGVDHVALDGAELQRLGLDHPVVLARLAEVDGEADDLGLVGVLDPLQHHAGVEPARVEQQDAVDLRGVGLVAGGRLEVWLLGAHARRKSRTLAARRGLLGGFERRPSRLLLLADGTSSASSPGGAFFVFFDRRFFFGRGRSVVVVVELSVGRGRRRRRWSDSRLEVVVSPPSSLLAITTTAISRPTITAIRQATSSRMLPCGRLVRAARPAVFGAHQARRVLVHRLALLRSQDRVEDRVGVLDLETVSQPLRRSPPGCCRRPPSGSPAGGRRRAPSAWLRPRRPGASSKTSRRRRRRRWRRLGRHPRTRARSGSAAGGARPRPCPSIRSRGIAPSVACRRLGLAAQRERLAEQRSRSGPRAPRCGRRPGGRPRPGPAAR